jgi:hypothetical protein
VTWASCWPFASPRATSMTDDPSLSWSSASSANSLVIRAIFPSPCWSARGFTSSPNDASACAIACLRCRTIRTHVMIAIERTAYPRFKRSRTAKDLAEVYTSTPAERFLALRSTIGFSYDPCILSATPTSCSYLAANPYTGWQSKALVQIDRNLYSPAGTHLAKSAYPGFRRLLLTPLGQAVLPLVGRYESG